jgi:hypothetical protein
MSDQVQAKEEVDQLSEIEADQWLKRKWLKETYPAAAQMARNLDLVGPETLELTFVMVPRYVLEGIFEDIEQSGDWLSDKAAGHLAQAFDDRLYSPRQRQYASYTRFFNQGDGFVAWNELPDWLQEANAMN